MMKSGGGQQTIRFVSFTNDKEHNLGQTPIPNGMSRYIARPMSRDICRTSAGWILSIFL